MLFLLAHKTTGIKPAVYSDKYMYIIANTASSTIFYDTYGPTIKNTFYQYYNLYFTEKPYNGKMRDSPSFEFTATKIFIIGTEKCFIASYMPGFIKKTLDIDVFGKHSKMYLSIEKHIIKPIITYTSKHAIKMFFSEENSKGYSKNTTKIDGKNLNFIDFTSNNEDSDCQEGYHEGVTTSNTNPHYQQNNELDHQICEKQGFYPSIAYCWDE